MGGVPLSLEPNIAAKHIFTHVIWQMQGISATFAEPFGEFSWFSPEGLTDEVAIPTAFRAYRKEFLKSSNGKET